jgi:hypothetical protein
MTRMDPDLSRSRAAPFAAATAQPPARAVRLPADTLAVPPDLLDGGEVVILAVKPSIWFILFEPLKWIALAVLLQLCIPLGRPYLPPGVTAGVLTQVILLLLGARMVLSLLRWVSRSYVLTNRRVMRVSGVRRPEVWACPLVRIRNTRLTAEVHERLVKLGTVTFVTDDPLAANRQWCFISRPEEVHAEVRRAIARALDDQPPG